MAKIIVQNTEITVIAVNGDDYISLTDLAQHKSDDPNAVIANWLRNRNTIEYLGIWEQLYNSNFKPTEFEGFRRQSGLNAFTLSPKKWTEATNAIGIIAKPGRYGGTYAHKDIALKFASWISVEFEQVRTVKNQLPYPHRNQRVNLFIEYGKPECRIYRTRHITKRATYQAKPNSNSSDERFGKQHQ